MSAARTRRSMLGMIAGVPVAATFGAIPVEAVASDRSAWEAALAAYRKADAEVDHFDKTYVHRATDVDCPIMTRFDELVDIEAEAFDAMWRTPSPNLAALIEKLRICADNDMAEHVGATCMAAELLADLRRLAAH